MQVPFISKCWTKLPARVLIKLLASLSCNQGHSHLSLTSISLFPELCQSRGQKYTLKSRQWTLHCPHGQTGPLPIDLQGATVWVYFQGLTAVRFYHCCYLSAHLLYFMFTAFLLKYFCCPRAVHSRKSKPNFHWNLTKTKQNQTHVLLSCIGLGQELNISH